MNLRKYYEAVKFERQKLNEPFTFVTSLATPNGGVEGCVREVESDVAARMIVDRVARLSEPSEVDAYLAQQQTYRAKAKEEELRQRVRITLVNESEFHLDHDRTQRQPRNRN